MAVKRKLRTAEEKAAILADLSQHTIAQTAKKHGVAESQIYAWKRQAGMGSGKKRRGKKKTKRTGIAQRARPPVNGAGKKGGAVIGGSIAASMHAAHALLASVLPKLEALGVAFASFEDTLGGKG